MAFDLAFLFRQTSGYVTNPSYGVFVSNGAGDAYPTLYTAANGFSINAGWDIHDGNFANLASGNDPRLAGICYATGGETRTFTIDLSSGSAPGAGLYTLDMSIGSHSNAGTQNLKVKDNTTDLITISAATIAAHYIDATGVDVAATTSWTGATVNKTFATTTCKLVFNPATEAGYTAISHFRLTLASSQSVVPVLMSQYRRRRDP